MKKTLALLLALAMLLSIMACAKAPDPQTPATPESEAPAEIAESETPAETVEAAPADPSEFNWKGSGRVTVYSGSASDISEDYFKAFTEMTGVEVDVVYGGGGELLSRVAAESANPLCDVLSGATSDNLTRYKEYFQPYKLESVTPEEIGATSLTEDYWTEGAGGNVMVFLVNTDLLAEEDIPTSWADLIDEKYFGQIAFVDPTASSSGYIHLNCMQQLYGWEFVETFYKNLDGKLIGSSSTAPKACADGEYAIALTIENNGVDYVQSGAHVKMIYPKDGTMRTAGGSVIIKNCKNPENAKLFCEFMYSKAAAEITCSYNRRCNRTDVQLPEGLVPFEEIFFMDYDYAAAADSEPVLAQWNEIVINN